MMGEVRDARGEAMRAVGRSALVVLLLMTASCTKNNDKSGAAGASPANGAATASTGAAGPGTGAGAASAGAASAGAAGAGAASAGAAGAGAASAGAAGAGTGAAPAGKCGETVTTDALPAWARAGFSGDGSGNPHVFGKSGDILGVIFGAPLKAPPAPDRGNKILWVSRAPLTAGSDLLITAKLDGTHDTVERKVTGGPGPSIIDLPAAGCWRLTLAWSGHVDTMDLTYSS
jgi:hypothetical protein